MRQKWKRSFASARAKQSDGVSAGSSSSPLTNPTSPDTEDSTTSAPVRMTLLDMMRRRSERSNSLPVTSPSPSCMSTRIRLNSLEPLRIFVPKPGSVPNDLSIDQLQEMLFEQISESRSLLLQGERFEFFVILDPKIFPDVPPGVAIDQSFGILTEIEPRKEDDADSISLLSSPSRRRPSFHTDTHILLSSPPNSPSSPVLHMRSMTQFVHRELAGGRWAPAGVDGAKPLRPTSFHKLPNGYICARVEFTASVSQDLLDTPLRLNVCVTPPNESPGFKQLRYLSSGPDLTDVKVVSLLERLVSLHDCQPHEQQSFVGHCDVVVSAALLVGWEAVVCGHSICMELRVQNMVKETVVVEQIHLHVSGYNNDQTGEPSLRAQVELHTDSDCLPAAIAEHEKYSFILRAEKQPGSSSDELWPWPSRGALPALCSITFSCPPLSASPIMFQTSVNFPARPIAEILLSLENPSSVLIGDLFTVHASVFNNTDATRSLKLFVEGQLRELADLLPVDREIQIGLLEPNAHRRLRIEFLAMQEGLLPLLCIKIKDCSTGEIFHQDKPAQVYVQRLGELAP